MKWLTVLYLRWRRKQLYHHIAWMRDQIFSGQAMLTEYEEKLRRTQANLWVLEAPSYLTSPKVQS
jgi:hypothetical protein